LVLLLSRCLARGLALRCLSVVFMLSLFAPGPAAAQGKLQSVAFWYAAEPPLPELAQYDWVVLEPGHIAAD
tara:strand:- start:3185 stop:3397 length:213 start_codon:yes stop_codon:yes gene_type:complete